MTYEDAIFWLDELKRAYIRNGDEDFDRQRKEAVTLAIKCVRACQACQMVIKDCDMRGKE